MAQKADRRTGVGAGLPSAGSTEVDAVSSLELVQLEGEVKHNEATLHVAIEEGDLAARSPVPSCSPVPSLTFTELSAKLIHRPASAGNYIFSTQLYLWYANIPVIGDGGTTFLFVFLKNPSSGLLKKYFRVRKD